MRAFIAKWALGAVVGLAWAGAAGATPLTVVNVTSSQVACAFNTTCHVTVTDSAGLFPPKPGYSGKPKLYTRTFVGAPGAQGYGLTAYLYQVDFTKAHVETDRNCAINLQLKFGAVAPLNYDGSGPADVFVMTSGATGSDGLASADKVGNIVTLTFTQEVCGQGAGLPTLSYYVGMASASAPRAGSAKVDLTFGGGTVNVRARTPDFKR
jgi:hypothetical protein